MGRISVPRLRQSRRPRHTRRDTLFSIEAYPFGPGLGVLPTPPRRFTLSPYSRSFAWGAFIRRRGVESRVGPRKFLLAKPAKPGGRPSRPSFWVPLTEGRRWYALGGKALATIRVEGGRPRASECFREVRGRGADRQGGTPPFQRFGLCGCCV